jgi:hypothetical protein
MQTRHEALEALRSILSTIRPDTSQREDSLHRVPISAQEEERLRKSVWLLLQRGLGALDRADQRRWGAAMLLLGARAFSRETEGPFTYARMAERLDMPGLEGALGHMEREHMAEGARWWGLELMRITRSDGSKRRQFLRTMLQHSGGGWAIVEALVDLVAKHWRFPDLARADIDRVASWIHDMVERKLLGKKIGDVLRDEETRYAMAERLLDMGAAWELAGEVLDQEPDNQDAVARLRTAGISQILDAPDAAAEQRMLERLCPGAREAAQGRVGWRWLVDARGNESLVVEMPERMMVEERLRGLDRLRTGVIGGNDTQRCVYSNQKGILHYLSGARMLTPAARAPMTVVAEYRRGPETGEIELAELTHNGGVMMFRGDTGRPVRCAAPGTSMALVPLPGWEIAGLDGFVAAGRAPWRGWVGNMPEIPVTYALRGPDGEEEICQLAPAAEGLEVSVGNAVDGLRLDGARVVCGTPGLAIEQIHGRVMCRVTWGGQEVARGRARVRARRVQVPVETWTSGRYGIELEHGGIVRHVDVVVLPESVRCSVTSGPDGTLVSMLGCDRADMHARDIHVAKDGQVHLAPEVRGRTVVDLRVAVRRGDAVMTGTWRVLASPALVDVMTGPEANATDERDIAILRGGGGLRILGQPRASVRVHVANRQWVLRLSPEGERFVPFVWIPSEVLRALKDRRLEVTVNWPEGYRKTLSFVDSSEQLLQHHGLEPDADRRLPRRFLLWEQSVAGDVHGEAVAAWQPWQPAIRLPVTPAMRNGGQGYAVVLDVPQGPYQMALMSGDRRISGMGLVWCNPEGGNAVPPNELGDLERELWAKSNRGRLVQLLEERLAREGNDAILGGLVRTLDRYGTAWFRIAEVLVQFLGAWRLRALIDEAWALAVPVERYYKDMGVPWLFVRRRDLELIGEWLAEQEAGMANRLLMEVADLRAGLLVAAVDAWQSRLHFDPAQIELLASLDHSHRLYKEGPGPLSPEALARVRQPGASLEAADQTEDEASTYSQRFFGLLELRGHEKTIWNDDALRRLLENKEWPPPDQLENRWFARIPERLEQIERAIARMAWHIHRWRRGWMRYDPSMQDIGVLAQYAQHSFDYWLNTWDALDP